HTRSKRYWSSDVCSSDLSPFVGGPVPVGVTVDLAGRFVFTANQGSYLTNYSGTVSAYAVDANTGALTPVPGSPFAAGLEPTSVRSEERRVGKDCESKAPA